MKLPGEAEGEGVVQAGAEGEDAVGEKMLSGAGAAALPPALLLPGRLRGRGAHRVRSVEVWRRRTPAEETKQQKRREEKGKCSTVTSVGWIK